MVNNYTAGCVEFAFVVSGLSMFKQPYDFIVTISRLAIDVYPTIIFVVHIIFLLNAKPGFIVVGSNPKVICLTYTHPLYFLSPICFGICILYPVRWMLNGFPNRNGKLTLYGRKAIMLFLLVCTKFRHFSEYGCPQKALFPCNLKLVFHCLLYSYINNVQYKFSIWCLNWCLMPCHHEMILLEIPRSKNHDEVAYLNAFVLFYF